MEGNRCNAAMQRKRKGNIDMKVAVTGANGYIGRHVVEALLDRGCDVVAVDVCGERVDKRAAFVQMSILDENKQVYKELGEPEAVIHLAWRDGFQHNSDAHVGDLSSHYAFVKNLLEGGLKNLSIMGSMHEIGYYEGAIDENTPANPLSMYGIAKNALRQSSKLLAKQYGASLKWLRGYYILGDDRSNHSIFTKLLEAAAEGKKTFPFTSGKNQYDFLDIRELSKQIAMAAMQTDITGEINCCSGKPVSLGERVEQFIRDNELDITLEYGAFPDRAYDSPAVWGDNTKIQRIMEAGNI